MQAMKEGMMKRLGLIAGVLVLLVAVGAFAMQGSAKDATGCDGLSTYRQEMIAAARSYGERMAEDGLHGRAIMSLSSDDWRNFAENALAYQRDLKAITPPSWAASWHETQIAYAGMAEQVAALAAESGPLAVAALGPQIDEVATNAADAANATAKTCADFAAFVADWYRFLGVDNPAATPTP